MIPISTYLEDFAVATSVTPSLAMTDEALETERLDSFDKGYRAG